MWSANADSDMRARRSDLRRVRLHPYVHCPLSAASFTQTHLTRLVFQVPDDAVDQSTV